MIILLGIILSLQVTKNIYFSMPVCQASLTTTRYGGYDIVKLEGCNFTDIPGEPQLPVKAVYFLLPNDSKVKEVKVNSADFEPLSGKYTIYPAQPPQILSRQEIVKFTEPKLDVYEVTSEYPGKLVDFKGEGKLCGHRIAEILIYPVQYIPKDKKIKIYTRIEISIELEKSSQVAEPFRPRSANIIKSLVINPEEISYQATELSPINRDLHFVPTSYQGYEYLIITSEALQSAFEPLANWKTSKGIPADIRTTEWIDTCYNGRDLAEKIRNYLKVVALDSGLVWVLLGGDETVVPIRIAYAMTCEYGVFGDEDSIPADLYYSDLDGSWDANENGIFGEVSDEIDLYPDVFVGRAPVNNVQEAQNFVEKTLRYEKNPPKDYLTSALFLAMILWQPPDFPYTDGAVSKNAVGELFPTQFNIQKLYESSGNETHENVINAINDGRAIINHNGHGWYMGIWLNSSGEYISIPDVDNLSNNERQGILYSIGCWCGALDYNCVGEHWVKSSDGGGVAFIGNSRYGWGSPGNPEYGYSDKFDKQFYYNVFKEDFTHIGKTLAKTKIDYIAFSREANVYRWHQYQLNLLGDPELDIFTDLPCSLKVAHPESLSTGESLFKVFVKSDKPVNGVLVCCMKNDEVYERKYTNELGEASFSVSPSSPGSLSVTVSGHNFYPYEGQARIFSDGPYPGYYSHSIYDSDGNLEINPGDSINLVINLKNFGSQPAESVFAILRTQNSYITVLDSIGNFGNIYPDSTSLDSFRFQVAPTCTNAQIIQFSLDIEKFGSNKLNFGVQTPVLAYHHFSFDTFPEPEDSFNLSITIKNIGNGKADSIQGKLSSLAPYITILDSIKSFEDLKPDSFSSNVYQLAVSQECPYPYFPTLELNLTTKDHSFINTFLLKLGQSGFFDDFESGLGNWTHNGTLDNWHITELKSHSGTHSWYCGDEVSQQYENNMDAWLLSPQFIVGPDAYLSFWYWFDTAIYGVDGIYIEVGDGTHWDTLDFMGSGGALDSLYFGNLWVPGTYELDYPVGSSLRVRFSFVSDSSDIGEGFYIDDFQIGYPIQICRLWIDDSLGNQNGEVDPGETVKLGLELINTGTSEIPGVYGILKSYNPEITILIDSSYFGNLESQGILGNSTNPYSFKYSSFAPQNPGAKLRFNLKIIGNYGSYVYNKDFNLKLELGAGVYEQKSKFKFSLSQNYPNPFTSVTSIQYAVSSSKDKSHISLKIYDVTGRLVNTLVDGEKEPGCYTITWDAKEFLSGIYFVKFSAGDYTSTKKLILMK
ncbi:T9SS type A sorting domain-containing protein [candidate division WOR-3 bacterium]|nr:T9SS type A sorting domain-containing protein [candidate division WOR-3 bacterium]